MKYLLIFLAFSGTTLLADTYQGKNGNKVAHNRAGTAVQTSNGTAVHARGSSTVLLTVLIMPVGTMGLLYIGTVATAVHTSSNWNSGYWSSHRHGCWKRPRGYWKVTRGS